MKMSILQAALAFAASLTSRVTQPLGDLEIGSPRQGKGRKNSGGRTSLLSLHAKIRREGWFYHEVRGSHGHTIRVWKCDRKPDWHKRPLSATPSKADVAAVRAAEAKRQRRAEKRTADAASSFLHNYAHWTPAQRAAGNIPKNLCSQY